MKEESIPSERLERNPLMTDEGFRLLKRIAQHPAAPKWNYFVGDRIEAIDLPFIEKIRKSVFSERSETRGAPPESIVEWVKSFRNRSIFFDENIAEGFDVVRDWGYIPAMTREDLALRPETIVPYDEDLSRLIVYDTSGTTGHSILAPYHPRAVGMNHPLAEFVLSRYGVVPPFGPDMIACLCIHSQVSTVVFPAVFSAWNQAGFAKVNLHRNEWQSPESARRFFTAMNPLFLTGNPISFSEMMRWEIKPEPAAIITTAVTLPPDIKIKFEKYFRCPVIDWYSSTETGPIAYSCPKGNGMHVTATDVYVEAIDPQGFPVAPGELGEIAVTGGRNPLLPLLRYRTGDWGRMEFGPCSCGDPHPRIVGFEGRDVVFYQASDGSIINPVDISRVLREFIFVRHDFIQHADGSCDLHIEPIRNTSPDLVSMKEKLGKLFGEKIELRIQLDPKLSQRTPQGRTLPYRTELSLDHIEKMK